MILADKGTATYPPGRQMTYRFISLRLGNSLRKLGYICPNAISELNLNVEYFS
jgi:hypothetical protein